MNDERAMLLFARLAEVSSQRGQHSGRDRFLILTGIAATRAGWPDVADCCHQRIVTESPRHLIARYPSFAQALRDPDFEPFVRRLRRFCSPERAEHLLTELGRPVETINHETIHESEDAGTRALRILSGLR